MKIELDLTRDEMIAIGYALASALLNLDAEDPDFLERAIFTLHEKVIHANERAQAERGPLCPST